MNQALEDLLKLGDSALDADPPRYADAATAYSTATKLGAKDARGYKGLGDVYFAQGKLAEAEGFYRRALALASEDSKPYFELGDLALARGESAEAIQLFRKALAQDPDDASLLASYGSALLRLGQLDLAAAQFTRAISLDQKHAAARSRIAMIYFSKGEVARAREQWQEAVRLSSASPLDNAGLLALDGKYREAAAQLEQYTSSAPDDEDAWLLLGDIRRASGDSTGASAAYARAATIAPDYAKLPRPALVPPIGDLAINGTSDAIISVEPAGGGEGKQGTLMAGRPLRFDGLRPGRYRVSARLEGYEPSAWEVEIRAGATATEAIELRPLLSTRALLNSWSDASGWSIPAGWSAGGRKLLVGGQGLAFPREVVYRNYGDFTLSSDVRMLNGVGVSFALRAADERNYYLIQLTGPQSDEPYQLRGFIVKDNVPRPFGTPVQVSGAASTVAHNKFFSVLMTVAGNNISVNVINSETGENTFLGNLTAPADGYKSGAVGVAGVGSEKNEVGRFAVFVKKDQADSNQLRGTVRDGLRGNPVSGAVVQFVDRASGSVVARRTNAEGGFLQDWLAPGAYSIRVSAPGFKTKEVEQTIAAEARGPVVLDPITLDANTPPARPAETATAQRPSPSPPSTPAPSTPTPSSVAPKPRYATSVRETQPEYGTAGTALMRTTGTIEINAPPGTRILVEPKVGKEGRQFTMPEGRRKAYVNKLPMGGYRIAAMLNNQMLTDQDVFVPPGNIVRVIINSRTP
ncbi:MAG TPA: tetratricopeptide repeat protein [Pyrinomonadaceae bacterium]|nr:tetratricopeptide repeat protein [Pyrinomonadaceae bacterium]